MIRKALESKSATLYKQANPFAYSTIKDWISLLQNSDEGAGESASAAGNRAKHPWELSTSDLIVGTAVGTGSHGTVFEGTYKGSRVAVKTLYVHSHYLLNGLLLADFLTLALHV